MLPVADCKSGTYSGYAAVPAEKLIKVPSDVPLEQAVGSCLMGITALALVKESYEVRKGDTILVHAAAGGVGLLLCQLINALGATVIGTASTKEKCETAKANGAKYMINYSEEKDWVKEVQKLAPNGVDCV
jgi:NADPH:quinone reductase